MLTLRNMVLSDNANRASIDADADKPPQNDWLLLIFGLLGLSI
jgi:hypothetical protein